MNPGPERKTVLITGATGGIGAATAIAFAQQGGYDLALHYNSANQETRDSLLSSIKSSSRDTNIHIAFFQADMGSYDSVRALHASVIKEIGEIDILFANAGTTSNHSGVSSLSDVPMDVFESTWRINTASPILLTQLCLPHMEAQGWGRVIFDSSVAAFTGGVVGPHYASSKSALHGFVHWLAGNVAAKGVTVNAIAPALIGGTTMMGGNEKEEEVSRRVAGSRCTIVMKLMGCKLTVIDSHLGIPVGRLGRPEEIAETVVWMAKTAYLTNKVIGVDGGYYPY